MSGPVWVLLRGLAREVAHWGDFPARLAAAQPAARVVALDLPGTGRWHAGRSPHRVAGIADHLRAQSDQLGLGAPLRLVGLSLGGMVAAQWAFDAWTQVSHLAVINTSMRPLGRLHERLRPACWAGLLPVVWARDAAAAERRVLHWTSADAAAHEPVLRDWTAVRAARPVSAANTVRQLAAAARFTLPAVRPSARTLVLASGGDRLVDPVCSRRLAARWQAPLEWHPTAGHDLPLDEPDWLVERLVRWAAEG